jgi:hypothetical protein
MWRRPIRPVESSGTTPAAQPVHSARSDPTGGWRVPLVAWYAISSANAASDCERSARKYVAVIASSAAGEGLASVADHAAAALSLVQVGPEEIHGVGTDAEMSSQDLVGGLPGLISAPGAASWFVQALVPLVRTEAFIDKRLAPPVNQAAAESLRVTDERDGLHSHRYRAGPRAGTVPPTGLSRCLVGFGSQHGSGTHALAPWTSQARIVPNSIEAPIEGITSVVSTDRLPR